jgi:hypothetical protein
VLNAASNIATELAGDFCGQIVWKQAKFIKELQISKPMAIALSQMEIIVNGWKDPQRGGGCCYRFQEANDCGSGADLSVYPGQLKNLKGKQVMLT